MLVNPKGEVMVAQFTFVDMTVIVNKSRHVLKNATIPDDMS